MYSTYELYISLGGSMTETEYQSAATAAWDKMVYYTFGRIANAPAEMQEKAAHCECRIADILHSAAELPIGVTAEGNDGVSVSYSQSAQRDTEQQIYRVCREHLTFPVNLMYAGVDFGA